MLGLGIDTGGTYTDSAIVDLEQKSVLDTGKSLTTKEDLTVGIVNSLGELSKPLLEQVEIVSISTTLATNAVVEGKGAPVATFAAAERFPKKFEEYVRTDFLEKVSGGHNLDGEEVTPLDEERIEECCREIGGNVNAAAVSSFLSPRNPNHELRMKKIIEENLDVPVVCGHQLSMDLGFPERTSTVAINASLIPIINDWIDSVERSLKNCGVSTSFMMIVKGDGSLINKETAKERPIETVISGPAASITGARFLTGEEDAWVIDMGGTTTDIGHTVGGNIEIREGGASLGGWKTKVKAVNIKTFGLGGDSRVYGKPRSIDISSERVIPISLASTWEDVDVLSSLKEASDFGIEEPPPYFEGGELLMPTDLILNQNLPKGCESIYSWASRKGRNPYSLFLRMKEKEKETSRAGFTPTDAVHCLRECNKFDVEAADYGAELLAKLLGFGGSQQLSKIVVESVIKKITKSMIEKALQEEGIEHEECKLIDILSEPDGRLGNVKMSISLSHPIVGVGAPVKTYLPRVAKKLGTQIFFPEHVEVANAIGAIAGNVVEEIEILIKPVFIKFRLPRRRDYYFSVSSLKGRREFQDLEEATVYARRTGEGIAKKRAMDKGAVPQSIKVRTVVKDERATGVSPGADFLLSRRIVCRAIGKPS